MTQDQNFSESTIRNDDKCHEKQGRIVRYAPYFFNIPFALPSHSFAMTLPPSLENFRDDGSTPYTNFRNAASAPLALFAMTPLRRSHFFAMIPPSYIHSFAIPLPLHTHSFVPL